MREGLAGTPASRSLGRSIGRRDVGALASRIAPLVSLPVFIIVWQLVSTSGLVNRVLTPAPSDVVQAMTSSLANGTMVTDVAWSMSRAVIGYLLGATCGVAVGLSTARYRIVNGLVSPILQALRPIPPIAIVPLTIVWFGISEGAKYFLIGGGVFFVVWIATHMGVGRINPLLIRAAQSLGVPERRMMREVIFPGALPFIIVGLRTSITIAFYSLVAAEIAGAFAGIAYRVDVAHQNMQTAQMFAALVALGVISALTDIGFNAIARRLVFWR